MNQKIKQKAYQLLIDKIDLKTFEEYLYELVLKIEMKSNSLLFEFVNINYTTESYKKELHNLIKEEYSEEELISLDIYEKCLTIIKSNNRELTLSLLQSLSDIYFSDFNEITIVYNFYRINMYDGYQTGYNSQTEEVNILKTKENANKVLKIFDSYKEDGNWIKFLSEEIEESVIEQISVNKKSFTEYRNVKEKNILKERCVVYKIINSLKEVLGLK